MCRFPNQFQDCHKVVKKTKFKALSKLTNNLIEIVDSSQHMRTRQLISKDVRSVFQLH